MGERYTKTKHKHNTKKAELRDNIINVHSNAVDCSRHHHIHNNIFQMTSNRKSSKFNIFLYWQYVDIHNNNFKMLFTIAISE